MNNEESVFFGKSSSWGNNSPVSLSAKERRQHLYIIGKTGTGKSTLLSNLIIQDINLGRGVAILDPHGDLAESILDTIPPARADDVIYFNPADIDFPIALNLFSQANGKNNHLVASNIVSIFKSIYSDSWGPRLEYLLYASVASLLECQNTSLLGVARILSDPYYRNWVIKQIKDPMLKDFWEFEFETYGKEFMTQAVAPIQNKLGQISLTPFMRNILGQVKSKVDVRDAMDTGKIFIANLNKGAIGEDKSNLLGSMLISMFQLSALSRGDLPENERKDFYLYADEFQNFATESFSSILSESRKFRLNLTICHQHSSQLKESIREAVYGNVGSIFSFCIGSHDAKLLADEFGERHLRQHLTELPNFEMIAKTINETGLRETQRIKALPSLNLHFGGRDNLIRLSRQTYATPKDVVEDKIKRWLNR